MTSKLLRFFVNKPAIPVYQFIDKNMQKIMKIIANYWKKLLERKYYLEQRILIFAERF